MTQQPQPVFDEAAIAASAPVALYAFPARAWKRDEYAALQDAVPALTAVSEPGSEAAWAGDSVEAMAERYARAIASREEAKGRPIALFGWSVGALVALEVARLLRERFDIAWVGAVDIAAYPQMRAALARAPALDSAEREPLDASLQQWLARSAMRDLWQQTLGRMARAQHDMFLREVVRAYGAALPADGPAAGSQEHTLWSRVNCLRLGIAHVATDEVPAPVRWWMSQEMSASPGVRTEGVEVIAGSDHMGVLADRALHAAVLRALEAVETEEKQAGVRIQPA
ncbi:thioesterase domain-containing protein [Variovorax boronicumulans]|uniref:thioesterase domain-containing protein n=1 Tax=Variovorax boronicumulans TaxID=436515 RepID=UPI0027897B4C|nr:thioesterase domain-containing protein [Variovorax boronicumulans]MDP9989733.1 thioesterase domain-containing protein [Variovorax boronicumulans]MDQ0005629.1 thioesterase domain-containing protein [Variovorax boronicumulans]